MNTKKIVIFFSVCLLFNHAFSVVLSNKEIFNRGLLRGTITEKITELGKASERQYLVPADLAVIDQDKKLLEQELEKLTSSINFDYALCNQDRIHTICKKIGDRCQFLDCMASHLATLQTIKGETAWEMEMTCSLKSISCIAIPFNLLIHTVTKELHKIRTSHKYVHKNAEKLKNLDTQIKDMKLLGNGVSRIRQAYSALALLAGQIKKIDTLSMKIDFYKDECPRFIYQKRVLPELKEKAQTNLEMIRCFVPAFILEGEIAPSELAEAADSIDADLVFVTKLVNELDTLYRRYPRGPVDPLHY